MPDDKNPSTPSGQSQSTNLDDLVKELSRPASLPPQAPMRSPTPPQPSPTLSNPIPSAKPPMPPTPPSSSAATVPKEYQSSIRTMQDDMAQLKTGGKVETTPTPRKVVPPPPPPPPVPPRPSAPSGLSKPAQPPIGTMPQRPTPPPVPPVTVLPSKPGVSLGQSQKSSPISPGSSQSHTLLFISIAVIAVVAGALYWFFVIREPGTPEVVLSPTPTLTPTETPRIATISDIFPETAGTINLTGGDPRTEFENQYPALAVNPGAFGRVTVSSPESISLSPFDLLDRLLITYPAELKAAANVSESGTFVYGQKEAFDSKGRLISNAAPSKRLVLVVEIKDVSTATQALKNWEQNADTSLASLFVSARVKQGGVFNDSFYQGVGIRYKNYPYPDKSIDYAILSASNGKYYLVLGSSRESTFAAIDRLLASQVVTDSAK